jgi:hypothetical protein
MMNLRRLPQLFLLLLGVSIFGGSAAQDMDCDLEDRELLVHASHVSHAGPALEMALYNMMCGARVNVLLCDEAALAVLTDEATHPRNLGKPKHLNINALTFKEGLANLRQGLENFTFSREGECDEGECQVYVCLISLAKLYDLDIQNPEHVDLLMSFLDRAGNPDATPPYRVDDPFAPELFEMLYSADSIIDF